jgi:hypothetical protein
VADDIVALSGGLPFALAVIGRQLAARLWTGWSWSGPT